MSVNLMLAKNTEINKKAKFTLEHATKAYRGAEVYIYSFFNLGRR